MMNLQHYFSQQEGMVSFTQDQASVFAKTVAGDFNPIHDPGAKRFCVPGDLLFCVLLNRYGVAETTSVQFSGMLDDKTRMCLPDSLEEREHIVDTNGRALLSIFMQGERLQNADFVSALSQAYVKFSGQTFPDILVPLMRSANAMINPERPLVIYKDMAIELNKSVATLVKSAKNEQSGSVAAADVMLKLDQPDISVNGRKGAVRLSFDIYYQESQIGKGEKNMVLSGLRDFDESAMQSIVEQYQTWRENYSG